MGRRLVASAPAVAGNRAATLLPVQRVLNSAGCAMLAFLVAMHALGGLAFGVLPVFFLVGFTELQGPPALLASLAGLALAGGWASHLVQRHGPAASAARCPAFRRWAYGIAAGGYAAALALSLLGLAAGELLAPGAVPGQQPRATWPLAPLPWVWPFFVAFARDATVMRLLVLGTCAVCASLLCARLQLRRPAFLAMGLAIVAAGAWFAGGAAWLYASARGLGGLHDAVQAQALQAGPGLYNARTHLAWWAGLGCIATGVLVMAGGLVLPARALQDAMPERDA